MNRARLGSGIVLGCIMLLCIVASIRISKDQFIGNYLFDAVGLTFHKLTVLAVFLAAWLLYRKMMKEINNVWINRAQLLFILLTGAALVSYVVIR